MRERQLKNGLRFFRWFFLLLAVLAVAGPSRATIRYTIHLNRTDDHIFDVDVSIPNAPQGVTVAMPAWNTLYQIRDFAYRIRALRASSGMSNSIPYTVRELDK